MCGKYHAALARVHDRVRDDAGIRGRMTAPSSKPSQLVTGASFARNGILSGDTGRCFDFIVLPRDGNWLTLAGAQHTDSAHGVYRVAWENAVPLKNGPRLSRAASEVRSAATSSIASTSLRRYVEFYVNEHPTLGDILITASATWQKEEAETQMHVKLGKAPPRWR